MSHPDSEILLAIGRLEGKVDTLIQLQRIHEERLKDHDIRIRDLENSKASIFGAAAVIGSISAVIISIVSKLIPEIFK